MSYQASLQGDEDDWRAAYGSMRTYRNALPVDPTSSAPFELLVT